VGVLGLSEFNAALTRVMTQADEAAKDLLAKAAAEAEAQMKSNFAGAHARGMPHVGGKQPNIVSGYLRRSITADPISRSGLGEYSTSLGPRAIYGRRVELDYGYAYFQPGAKAASGKFPALSSATWRSFLGL